MAENDRVKQLAILRDAVRQRNLEETVRYNLGKGLQEYSLTEIAQGLSLDERDLLLAYLDDQEIHTAVLSTVLQRDYGKQLEYMGDLLGMDFIYDCMTPAMGLFFSNACEEKKKLLQSLHLLADRKETGTRNILSLTNLLLIMFNTQEAYVPYYTTVEMKILYVFLKLSYGQRLELGEEEWKVLSSFWGNREKAGSFLEETWNHGEVRLDNIQLRKLLEFTEGHQLTRKENQEIFKMLAREKGIHIPKND